MDRIELHTEGEYIIETKKDGFYAQTSIHRIDGEEIKPGEAISFQLPSGIFNDSNFDEQRFELI